LAALDWSLEKADPAGTFPSEDCTDAATEPLATPDCLNPIEFDAF